MTLEDLRPRIEDDMGEFGEYIFDQYRMDYSNEEEHWAYFAAAVHHYLRTQVEYADGHDGILSPRTTWEHGGRCGDQSVLAASIFSSYGYPWRIVNVDSPQYERVHALLEVGFPKEAGLTSEGVHEGLRRFYRSNGIECGTINRNYSWKDILFYPMDTEYSDYVGDLQHLAAAGFADIGSDGWSWTTHWSDEDVAFDGYQTYEGSEIY